VRAAVSGHPLTDRPEPTVERVEREVRVHGPASSGWLLVALCAATGVYCLLRMRSSVEEQRRAAGGEALMGFGMAVMAVPAAVFTPPSWAWPAYAVVFGAGALHALWAARTDAHHLHHLVGAAAMVYMAVVMAASPGHTHGHGDSGEPLVTGALLLYFAGYVLLTGVRLVPVPAMATGGGAARWGDRPELARACRLSMGIAMVTMLLTL
jgi:peptidoglycan/LPS O-acetylase OafA/YrhL